MEVIKSGKDRRQEVTCLCCGSVIAYEDAEIQYRMLGTQVTLYGMERECERYIICPECGKVITLP
jgi:Fe2+ or Zn2+ uptake regulation protein